LREPVDANLLRRRVKHLHLHPVAHLRVGEARRGGAQLTRGAMNRTQDWGRTVTGAQRVENARN
jgi:hypothetical protein